MIRNVYGHSTGTHKAGDLAWLPASVAEAWIKNGWAMEEKSIQPEEKKV
ncbi:MAG: hypothetical protein BWY79_01012 [Actinobacteria bacterium ADurb.Bin444]|nr:MAG: hypothetical protein BWY79_01012 [Actinobacteria bacterium ADurb.Bin444]